MLASLSILLVLSGSVLTADLTCHRFIPQGRTSNVGALQFTGGGVSQRHCPFINIVLTAKTQSFVNKLDAIAGNPVVVDVKRPVGTTFHFESCNSTTLDAYPYQLKGCQGGCSVDWYDNIRIVHSSTGHCLTVQPARNNYNELVFKNCNNTYPADGNQLFSTYQHVSYGPKYSGPSQYGAVVFVPYGFEVNYDPSSPAGGIWFTASDRRTLLWPQENFGVTEDPNSINGFVVVNK